MSEAPGRVMVAGDGESIVALCRDHGCGIEIQCFLEPERVAEHRSALDDLHPRSLHGPFGDLCPGSYDPMIREVTRNRFELACTFAHQLETPDIILHHGYVPGTSFPENWLRRCVEFWQTFLAGKDKHVRFHVENMLEWDGGLLSDVIDGIGDPRVDVCLDIGHCHCNSRQTPVQWIERLGRRIGWVHVHDNHAKTDEHLAPGAGTIPMDEVGAALLEHCPEAVWCLEALDEELPASLEWLDSAGFGR